VPPLPALFLALGVNEPSVPPARLDEVRAAFRCLTLAAAARSARSVLLSRSCPQALALAVSLRLGELGLQPGVYQMYARIENAATKEVFEWQHGCTSINVEAGKKIRGIFYMPHSWRQG